VILLLELVTCALACPCLDEALVKLKSLLSICKTSYWLHELDVGKRTVAKKELVVRVTLETLIELFDGSWEITLFEKLITTFFVLFSDFWINVSQSIFLLFFFDDFLHGFLDIVVVVLEKCLAVEGNRLFKHVLFEECIRLSCHRFTKLHEVIWTFLCHCDGPVTLLDHFIILSHLEVYCSKIGVVSELFGIQLDGLRV